MPEVSIHTPTKGVTTDAAHGLHALGVSIHTPAKGVTQVGCRGDGKPQVSIHTPAKGVTCLCADALTCPECFNPHAREGRDGKKGRKELCAYEFQSTRPRRA